MTAGPRIIQSHFHTPTEAARKVFTVVLRAGHLQASPDYRVERRICAGCDLLLCLRGRGYVQVGGRSFPVAAGQMAWLNGRHPHAHWAEEDEPWELLWLRIDGASLDEIIKELRIEESPVFDLPRPGKAARLLRRVLGLLRTRPAAMEALAHAEVTCLIALLFEARQWEGAGALGDGLPAGLRKAVEDLSLYYYRPWRVKQLARDAGMSVPHFFRCFRKVTGSTPISFLRRERINQAKRRLTESGDSMKQIAEQVGYSDQFYFSRDFRRLTGVSPSEFRRREGGPGAPPGARGARGPASDERLGKPQNGRAGAR